MAILRSRDPAERHTVSSDDSDVSVMGLFLPPTYRLRIAAKHEHLNMLAVSAWAAQAFTDGFEAGACVAEGEDFRLQMDSLRRVRL